MYCFSRKFIRSMHLKFAYLYCALQAQVCTPERTFYY